LASAVQSGCEKDLGEFALGELTSTPILSYKYEKFKVIYFDLFTCTVQE
jgi:hypothetical protein